jgi:DNA-binding response OmpR family regulator
MSGAKVLYLDDELDLLDLAAGFFEDEHIAVDTCSEFHEALDLVRANDYAVILSDAKMPSGSGHEFFRRLRRDHKYQGKLILVTGNLEPPGAQEATGYDLVIYKPIEFPELVETVKAFLVK